MAPAPEFIKSEYFVPEPDNWHLKPGAPKEVVEEFEKWNRDYEENAKKGIMID